MAWAVTLIYSFIVFLPKLIVCALTISHYDHLLTVMIYLTLFQPTSYHCFRHCYSHWSIFPPSSNFHYSLFSNSLYFQTYYLIIFSSKTYFTYISSYSSTRGHYMALFWLNYYPFRFTTLSSAGRNYYWLQVWKKSSVSSYCFLLVRIYSLCIYITLPVTSFFKII